MFSLSKSVTISLSSLLAATLTVAVVASGHTYSLYVNGTLVSYTATGGDTAITIAAALVAAITALAVSTITVTNLGTGAFTLTSADGLTAFGITSLDPDIVASNYASPGIYLCTVTGPVAAPVGSVNTINNAVSGLTAVSNLAVGAPGTNKESNAAFRSRRYTALYGGNATDVAIAAYLLNKVANVTFAYCVSNRTLSADALGRPAKSFEVQVIGGATQDIANGLWLCMPSGIQPYGNVGPITVIDSVGNPQIVFFSRPVPQYIWRKVVTTPDSSGTYPPNGGALIKAAIVVWAAANMPVIGGTLKLWSPNVPIATVPGIESATVTVAVTSTPTPPGAGSYGNADAVLTTQQQAIFAVSQILVNGV
jgi:hypothetical protein